MSHYYCRPSAAAPGALPVTRHMARSKVPRTSALNPKTLHPRLHNICAPYIPSHTPLTSYTGWAPAYSAIRAPACRTARASADSAER